MGVRPLIILGMLVAVALAGCTDAGPQEQDPLARRDVDSGTPPADQDPGDDGGQEGGDDPKPGPEPTPQPTPQPPGPDPKPGTPDNTTEPQPEPVRSWPPLASATIRPGVQTYIDGGQCTSNFVFMSRDGKDLYLGHAAHCSKTSASPFAESGCTAGSLPIGTPVEIEGASSPGELAYVSWITMQEVGEMNSAICDSNDFALIKIPKHEHSKVHPAMQHFGGPTGLAEPGTVAILDKVITYGNSGLRFGVEPYSWKEGYVTGTTAWYHSLYTAGPGLQGDSGSGVLLGDGTAMGILVHAKTLPPGESGVTDAYQALEYARVHAGLDIVLATWDVIDSGVLP